MGSVTRLVELECTNEVPIAIIISQTHLPGYVDDFDSFKSKGVEVVACVSVNDAFVMDAWGKSHGATGKIRMLADTTGEFTKVY